MNIQGFQKTTLLDFPRHVAATVFMGGCNFCCPFCHNSGLVLSVPSQAAFSPEEVLAYLNKRKRILDGVCITGGEPTLQKDLGDFLRRVKDLGLAVKLDTNGYRPQVLKELRREGLLDYVAMDIKGSPDKYPVICGRQDLDMERIYESAEFLMEGNVAYEFRTTVMKEFHETSDFLAIGAWLQGAEAYFLQGYQDSPEVISPGFTAYTAQELKGFLTVLAPFLPQAEIRGVE